MCTNMGCTCSLCEQSYHIKFDYEGMKTAGVTDYSNQTLTKHLGWINSVVLSIERGFAGFP